MLLRQPEVAQGLNGGLPKDTSVSQTYECNLIW
jgi:hypothetical protein